MKEIPTEIVVAYSLIDQFNKNYIPKNRLKQISAEFKKLQGYEEKNDGSLDEYLRSNNSLKFKGLNGSSYQVFKYRFSSGDRILYTYGKYFENKKIKPNTIILLGYAKHDDQERFALNKRYSQLNAISLNEALDKKIIDFYNQTYELNGDNVDLSIDELEVIYSYSNGYSVKSIAVSNDQLANLTTQEIDKYLLLSQEQDDVIKSFFQEDKGCTYLISGSAGTGKTLVSLYIIENLLLLNSSSKAMYFTQSYKLLQKVSSQYEKISLDVTLKENSSQERIKFKNINDFCVDILNNHKYEIDKLLLSQQFENDFFENFLACSSKYINIIPPCNKVNNKKAFEECKRLNITASALWTEIRGTIKGGMVDWLRTGILSTHMFSGNFSSLFERGILIQLEGSNFRLAYSLGDFKDLLENDTSISNKEKQLMEQIYNHCLKFNFNEEDISEEYYKSLPDEYAFFTKENRDFVWKLYLIYKDYLKFKGLFDENDLVRLVFKTSLDKISESIDFVVVDEIQDYTEMQIYLLFKMTRNKNRMVLSGDINQIINPTLFNVGKLKKLYSYNKIPIKERNLTANFRCQKGIVGLINTIAEIRKKIIGARNIEKEQEEVSCVKNCFYQPLRLKFEELNFNSLIKEISKYPQVAVIVPDIATKNDVVKVLSKYTSIEMVYTIHEIKGIEFQYIICYDIFGKYINEWNYILDDTNHDNLTLLRYYFNVVYVAASRAQSNICFIDKYVNPKFETILKLNEVHNFDADALYLSTLKNTFEDWVHEGDRHANDGNYKEALDRYNEALKCDDYEYGEFDLVSRIYYVKANMYYDERDYTKTVKNLILYMISNDSLSDKKSIKHILDNKKIQKEPLFFLLKEQVNRFSSDLKEILNQIKIVFNDVSSEELEKVFQLFNEKASSVYAKEFYDYLEIREKIVKKDLI